VSADALRMELLAVETLAITLYANDRTNDNDPARPSWMELPPEDRTTYRAMARDIASPAVMRPERAYER